MLKKTVRQKKKGTAPTFAGRPAGDLLNIISNIRSRAPARNSANVIRSTADDLEMYADYFSEIYAANRDKSEAVGSYIILLIGDLAH